MNVQQQEHWEYEENARYDYHSELWAGERESMRLEGYYAGCEELDGALERGEITQACHTIWVRRLQAEYGLLDKQEPAEAPFVSPAELEGRDTWTHFAEWKLEQLGGGGQ